MSIKKLPPARQRRKAKKENSFKIIIPDFSPDCNAIASRAGKKGRPFSKAALGGIQMAYYYNPPTLERVNEEDAYQYIMDKLEQDPKLAQEARDALIFWYFSGDCWRKMEESS